MKRYSLLFKFLAFLLSALCFLSTLFCGYGIVSLVSANLYHDYPDSLAQTWCYGTGRDRALAAARFYAAIEIGNCPKELVEHLYGLNYYGGSQVIVQQKGETLYTAGIPIKEGITINYHLSFDCPVLVLPEGNPENPDQEISDSTSSDISLRPIYTYEVLVDGQRITYEVRYQEMELDAIVTLDQSVLNNTNYQLLSWLFPMRYVLIWGLALSLLLGISMLVYLLWVAGRNKQGGIEPTGLSKLPLDIYLAAAVGFLLTFRLLFYAFVETVYSFHVLIFNVICIGLLVPLILGFLYILAAQSKCKGGYWWYHTIIGRVLRLCLKGIQALFLMLPAVWQWLTIGFFMAFSLSVSFILGYHDGDPFFRLTFLLCAIASLGMICYSGYCFGTLLVGSKKMAQGHLDYQIPEKYLFGAFKDCARQLNSLSGAANSAMQSKIRSERMKTELITNVSHDIKTPLTSIISFVDLLEKPHSPEDEEQYLDVLSRQSQRLKKLIEDLMELSKANSGNITVNPITLDAVEAANQALGEFSDKLEAAQLTPVFRAPEQPLLILADGRLTWRVLSNLLGNAVKYAAPNTRVYVDLEVEDDQIQLSIRNISKAELNITAEELLERFVRGDVSRNTEGSGLGLNIAKSLMEVQHGKLTLTLDGDLFKVTLTFPKA